MGVPRGLVNSQLPGIDNFSTLCISWLAYSLSFLTSHIEWHYCPGTTSPGDPNPARIKNKSFQFGRREETFAANQSVLQKFLLLLFSFPFHTTFPIPLLLQERFIYLVSCYEIVSAVCLGCHSQLRHSKELPIALSPPDLTNPFYFPHLVWPKLEQGHHAERLAN